MKALIACTNHSTYPEKTNKTGLWLSDLTHFYTVLLKKRILIDFVSPKGGLIPIDERSLEVNDEENHRLLNDTNFRDKLTHSLQPSEIDPKDYRIIYFPGGHGAMWDLPENAEIQAITQAIYERRGMVTAVGHGLAGLLHVKLANGDLLIKDKYLTGFTNMEETLASLVSETPFYLEDKLKEQGAVFTKSILPFVQFIEVDERLITGQNPASSRKVAQKVVEEISEK